MDLNKAHDYDSVSIKTLKVSCPSIIKPLLIIFPNCLKFVTFLGDWVKGNVVPVHTIKNKLPITTPPIPIFLQPTCFKVFEKLIFDAIFEFMIENDLLSST